MPRTNEGMNWIQSALYKGATLPADTLFIGLATAAPSAASTLATISEHTTAGGYARKQLTSANSNISAAGVMTMGAAVAWGPGITLTNATHWFLCNVASGTAGKLYAWGALSATRSLTTADTLTESLTDTPS